MEEVVSQLWVDSSFQEPSDNECQGPNLDTRQPQTAVLNQSIESQLTGLKKQILINPLLYNTGDSGDVGHTQMDTGALKPHFRQCIVVG